VEKEGKRDRPNGGVIVFSLLREKGRLMVIHPYHSINKGLLVYTKYFILHSFMYI